MTSIGSKTINLKIGVNWLYGIGILATVLILAFIFVPQPTVWRPVLAFSAAVIAGAAGLTTAINNMISAQSPPRRRKPQQGMCA